MPSSKVANLTDYAGGQGPADLAYLVRTPFGVTDDRKSTLNDLFAEITKNITDLSVQFGDGAAATVSAVNKGKIRYNDSVSAFQVSEDGGAYASLIKGAGANGRVAFYTAASVISSNSNFFWDNTNARLGIGVGSTPGLPLDVAADVSALAQQWRENGAGTARVQMQIPSSFGQLGTSSAHDFGLIANGTQRLNIESGGAIAVGSVSVAQGQFHIRAAATGTIGFVSDNAASTSVDLAQLRINGSNRFVFTNGAQMQAGLASSITGSIRFFVSGSANHSTLQAGDTPASNVLYKWPADDPAAGEVLKVTSFSGGTAVLEWGTGGGSGTVTGSGTATRVAFWTSASAIGDNANFYWDNTNARLGIGVGSTPGLPLDVAADVSALAQQWRENGAGTARVQMQIPSSFGQLGTSSAHDFGLIANGTQRLNIESGGAIAVGSVSVAQGQFHIRAAATGTIGFVSDNAASTSVDLAQLRINGSNRFVFTNGAQMQAGLASSITGSIRFFVSGSANHSTLQAGDTPASNVLYKWPADDPAAGEVLKVTSFSGGTAVLEWGTGGGSGTVTGSGTATRVAFWTSASAIGDNANFYWDNTNARLGIGVGSTPGLPLDVAADVSALAQQWRENGAGTARVQMQIPSSFGQLGTSSAHDFGLIANGTQRLNIESGGAIAVGSVSVAQGQFHIRAAATGTIGFVSDNAASTSVDLAQLRINGSNRFVFTNGAQMQAGLASNITGSIRFFVSGSANHSTLQAGDTPASNVLYKWPADDPAAGEVLKVTSFSGGTAVLEWGAAGSGSPGTPQYSVQFNNPLGTFAGDAGFTYNPTVGTGTHWLFQGPADTGLTASTEAIGIDFDLDATRTFATGAITLQREVVLRGPTYAFAGASVITTAISFDVSSPLAGTNATLTNSYAGRFNASAAAHVALIANSAASPTGNIFETQINGVATTGFRVTKDGLPSSIKSGYTNVELYGGGITYSPSTGNATIVIGQGATVSSTGGTTGNAVLIGQGGTISGAGNWQGGIAIGQGVFLGGSITAQRTIVIGASAYAGFFGTDSSDSVVIGSSAGGSSKESVVIGSGATGNGSTNNSVVVGRSASVSSASSIALGNGASVAAGNANSLVAGSSSHPTNHWYGGKGITDATPTAYTVNGTGGSGSNIAGATINIFAGKPTGNASPGNIGHQFARPGSSGSTLASQSDQIIWAYSTDEIRQTWQLQSSTTANQDAARLAGFWTTTTHAFRTAAFSLSLVDSAAAITEFYRWTPTTFVLHEGTVPNVWTSGSYLAKIYAIDDVLNPTIQAAYFSNTGGTGGVLSLLKGRGTNASPTAIQSTDRIGDLEWWGQFNTSTNNNVAGARIRVNATENWSSGNNGCNMEFYTAPNASTVTLRMVLTQTGTLRINPNGAYSSFTSNNLLQVGNYASWNNDAIAGIYTQSSSNKGLEIIGLSSQTADMLRCFLDSVTPDLLTLNAAGVLATRMGASSAQANHGATAEVNTTAASNSSTTETDLITYSLPASSLNTNGDYIEIEAWGTYAANGNTKQIKLKFGASTLVDTGAVIITGSSWIIRATIVRTSATAQKYIASFNDTQNLALQLNAATAAETLSGAITIKCTGQGGASTDITQEGLIVRWHPNA